MSAISLFDLLFALALLAGMAAGFMRGFLRQLTEIAALYVGLAVAAQYTPFLATSLDRRIASVPYYVTTAIVFFVVMSVVAGILSLIGHTLLHPSVGGERPIADHSDASQILGLLLGAFSASVLIAIAIPIIYYATAGSWGRSDGLREFLGDSLHTAYLTPVFGRLTPLILGSVQPLLPGGIPPVLYGRLM